MSLGTHRLDRRFDNGRKGYGSNVEDNLALDDARDVQQILDELGLCLGIALNNRQTTSNGVFVEATRMLRGKAIAENFCPAHHGIERRAEFVGQHREKLILHAVGGFRFLTGNLFAEHLCLESFRLFAFGDVFDRSQMSKEFVLR